jgi:type I restriction enzyme S subunit
MTELPSTWSLVTLNDLQADEPRAITDGPFGSNLTSAHYSDSGARVIRLQNIGDGRFIDAEAYVPMSHFETLKGHEARSGDLIVASLGEVLPKACLVPPDLGPAIVKADCIRVRLGDHVEPRWALYAMQTPEVRRWAAEQLHGVGRPRLGLKVIRQLPVPLPPIDEQRRIVDILEDYLSRLDAAVAGVLRVPHRLGAMRLSALTRQRQRLLDCGAPSRPLGEVAETALGKMLDAKRSHGVPTPYLRNINVRWGAVDVGDVQTVPLSEGERAKFALEPGDLLVCEGGEPGRCAVWPGSEGLMTFQKALHRVRVRDEETTDIRFVALMLEEFIRSGRADTMYTGTTIRHLPQEKLRLVTIPLPPLEAQVDVVASMEDLTDSMALASHQADTAVRRAATLRRSLLAAAFSGRLTETPSAPTSEVYAGV